MWRVSVGQALLLVAFALARPVPAGAQSETLCDGKVPTVPIDGATVIRGGPHADVIFADDAISQVIDAAAGADTICAGAGDIVYAGPGDDHVLAVGTTATYGESGNDFIISLTFGAVSGGPGNDTLIDGYTATLSGDAGRDTLISGAHCDGGSGQDSALDCASVVNVP